MLTQKISRSPGDVSVWQEKLSRAGGECCFHELKCCTCERARAAGLMLHLYMKQKQERSFLPETAQPPPEHGFLQGRLSEATVCSRNAEKQARRSSVGISAIKARGIWPCCIPAGGKWNRAVLFKIHVMGVAWRECAWTEMQRKTTHTHVFWGGRAVVSDSESVTLIPFCKQTWQTQQGIKITDWGPLQMWGQLLLLKSCQCGGWISVPKCAVVQSNKRLWYQNSKENASPP